MPLTDLLPSLRRDRGVVVGKLDPYGLYPVLRFNQLHGPTANRAIRQAIMGAVDPRDAMQAIMGDDTDSYHAPIGAFLPGTAYANDAAMDRIGPRPAAELQELLKSAKYGGEKIVVMHPTDQPFYDAMTQVVVAALKKAGLNVDDQAMDWGTVVQRRGSKAPLDQGGWSLFVTSFPALDFVDPLSAPALRGNGEKAWYGWPDDPKAETLRNMFIEAGDEATRKHSCEEIQKEAFTEGMYLPLGQYFQSAAWRTNLTGHLKAQPPLFWNVKKA